MTVGRGRDACAPGLSNSNSNWASNETSVALANYRDQRQVAGRP